MIQACRNSRKGATLFKQGLHAPKVLIIAQASHRTFAQMAQTAKKKPKLLTGMEQVSHLLSTGRQMSAKDAERKKLVILGSGWGACYAIKNLGPAALLKYDITVVSPTNHFVYTPMLPSVTVGTLNEQSVMEPVQNLMGKLRKLPKASLSYNEAKALSVDPDKQTVKCKDVAKEIEFDVPYDVLVCTVGATTNTFGTPGAMDNCHFLKSVQDAQKIRSSLANCFEAAEAALKSGAPQSEIDRLLSFVIVGAGPTGVEVAAEFRDFISEDMLKYYPQFKDEEIKVQVVEMGNRVLGTYDKSTSLYTEKRFKLDDIEVLCQHQVKKVNEDSIEVMDLKKQELKKLPFGMCVWASGVRPNDVSLELAKHFGTRMLEVDPSLRVRGSNGTIFAIGDCAKITVPSMKADVRKLFAKADTNKDGILSEDEFGTMMEDAHKTYPQLETFLAGAVTRKNLREVYRLNVSKAKQAIMPGITPDMLEAALTEIDQQIKMLPPTAQVASQQGAYLGKVLSEVPYEELAHPEGFEPHFKYDHQGSMAYVGSHRAVIDSPQLGNLRGLVSGVMWKGAYWAKAISTRSKILMALAWGRSHTLGRGWILNRAKA